MGIYNNNNCQTICDISAPEQKQHKSLIVNKTFFQIFFVSKNIWWTRVCCELYIFLKRMFFVETSYSQILDNLKIDDFMNFFVLIVVLSCNLTFSTSINPFNSI